MQPSEPLITSGPRESPSPVSSDAPHTQHKQHVNVQLTPHSTKFDLWLARGSLILEAICYAVMAIVPTVPVFAITGMLLSFAGGFNPAVQALALELYVRRNKGRNSGGAHVEVGKDDEVETGRLFGALSVVSSISYVPPSHIHPLSP